MFLVGLTGGVATGKSTVGKMFLELGVPVIDADLMARKIVEPGRPAYKKIRAVRECICEIVTATYLVSTSFVLKLIVKNLTLEAERMKNVQITSKYS